VLKNAKKCVKNQKFRVKKRKKMCQKSKSSSKNRHIQSRDKTLNTQLYYVEFEHFLILCTTAYQLQPMECPIELICQMFQVFPKFLKKMQHHEEAVRKCPTGRFSLSLKLRKNTLFG